MDPYHVPGVLMVRRETGSSLLWDDAHNKIIGKFNENEFAIGLGVSPTSRYHIRVLTSSGQYGCVYDTSLRRVEVLDETR